MKDICHMILISLMIILFYHESYTGHDIVFHFNSYFIDDIFTNLNHILTLDKLAVIDSFSVYEILTQLILLASFDKYHIVGSFKHIEIFFTLILAIWMIYIVFLNHYYRRDIFTTIIH